ncbi:ferritin-like domain-containing protein [uncultured Marixanthomonas sp.]|uniref:YciE/YciF ferroxidase family protein n=1 Tax=uncultured Marixanthomonas sp. TaxID=757245 RepID=UPI0030DD7CEE|tara:strand:- start:40661 stop:41143 length:483 start_codon:yes stop_codon:yes gene_type:complete
MNTLHDLFIHQLRDLYSAEKQLIQALPEMVQQANNSKLEEAFSSHLEETKEHKKRLEEVFDTLDVEPGSETCEAMQGLIKEAKNFLDQNLSDEVKNAGMIAEAQRIEHYEIAGYGTVCTYAEELGHDDILQKLKTTLDEEYGADDTLKELAKSRLNKKAI